MFPKSIRSRLPLSYGAIAFLATLFLGLALITSLTSFYYNQERTYLENNAQVISNLLGRLYLPVTTDTPADRLQLLQSQVNTFAFITQVQIRVFDENDALLADSGNPETLQATSSLSLQVALEDQDQTFSQTIETEEESLNSVIVIESGGHSIQSSTSILGSNVEEEVIREGDIPLSLLETPLTFGPGFTAESDARSSITMRMPVINTEAGLVGFVELSQGPAFGRTIVQDVTAGLILAGILATLLAALAGWWMSSRLSRPIQSLATTTEQMAAGDLSVRANIDRKDELGQLANSFNGMADQIEETVSTLRQFVADAAHELNTPLTALRTNLELAARRSPEDENLSQARLQASRLERLNDDLLRLSRLESGLSDDKYEPLDINKLLNENAELFAARAEYADVDFYLSTPQAPVQVLGNKDHLQRVLNNLIDNALKFTPAHGKINVTLSTNGEWSTLSIEDTGTGISQEDLPYIFNRFHRGRNTAEFPGSGLGLAMVKTIVEKHKGYVTVTSQPDQGTKVSVRLPVLNATSGQSA